MPSDMGAGLDRAVTRWDDRPALLVQDIAAITLATLFLLLPLGMVVLDGLPRLLHLPEVVFGAASGLSSSRSYPPR